MRPMSAVTGRREVTFCSEVDTGGIIPFRGRVATCVCRFQYSRATAPSRSRLCYGCGATSMGAKRFISPARATGPQQERSRPGQSSPTTHHPRPCRDRRGNAFSRRSQSVYEPALLGRLLAMVERVRRMVCCSPGSFGFIKNPSFPDHCRREGSLHPFRSLFKVRTTPRYNFSRCADSRQSRSRRPCAEDVSRGIIRYHDTEIEIAVRPVVTACDRAKKIRVQGDRSRPTAA
jgi:hypothetical protein